MQIISINQNFDYAVVIGRFQPLHLGHWSLICTAHAKAKTVIVLIGSAGRARSSLNPFTYDERVHMIRAALHEHDQHTGTAWTKHTHFAGIPDIFYDEARWCEEVIDAVHNIAGTAQRICLLGHSKDASSYYLKEFPDWLYLECSNYQGLSATPLREQYLLTGSIASDLLPHASQQFLQQFQATPAFAALQHELRFITRYQESWRSAPYPPIFVTTDSVVICERQILLIERKYPPGQGLLALPGGFVEANEWIQEGLLRELKEETEITVSSEVLISALQRIQVFDYPKRSQIGRVITHAGLFQLQELTLPEVKGSDDAGRAFWLALEEFWQLSDQLHDDHFQIVSYFKHQGLLDV